MQNVIAFPRQAVTQPVARSSVGSKTLFLHIKRTTLIVHLAGRQILASAGTRIGKQV